MSHVATLIAAKGAEPRLSEVVASMVATLNAAPDWLAPGFACDLFVDGLDLASVEAAARQAIGDASLDVLIQPGQARRKRLFAADLESTIIENEMLDELADFAGMRTEVSEITRRAMNGELDFVQALAARVALLKGLPA